MRALLIYPTHSNLAEELRRYEEGGFDVAAYPVRTTQEGEQHQVNCWNSEADQAEAAGFPVVETICPRCPRQGDCRAHGYLAKLVTAREAEISLATHQRVACTGFSELAADREYITVHENPIDLLRPTCTLASQDLPPLFRLLHQVLGDPKFLNWFSESHRRDDDAEQVIRRQRIYEAAMALDDLLQDLQAAFECEAETTVWISPKKIVVPSGFESFLWWAAEVCQIRFTGNPWRFVLAALAGELHSAAVIVSERAVRDAPQGSKALRKSFIGVEHNPPPSGRVVWFNDATLEPDRLQRLLGREVIDGTPNAQIPFQNVAVQYVRDITRSTSLSVIQALLCGLLAKRRDCARVGLITHRPLLQGLAGLEEEFRSRIVMSTYFGSGEERSSNVWHQQCDLIVILGTPRVPPQAVAEYLVQVGDIAAACRKPPWGTLYWQGKLPDGGEKRIEGRGYLDPDWRRAHRDLVRATLVQAIGRGRLTLESGCDVVVCSSEECGLRVIDGRIPWLNEEARQIWSLINQLTAEKSKRDLLEKVAVSTAEVAQQLDRPERTVRNLLTDLEWHGLVYREGPRSGWKVSPPVVASPSLKLTLAESVPS